MADIEQFRKDRDGIKTLPELLAWLTTNLKGFSFSLTLNNRENPGKLGFMNGFVNAPPHMEGVKSIYVIGQTEEEFVQKTLQQLPRLIIEVQNIEEITSAERSGAPTPPPLQTSVPGRTPRENYNRDREGGRNGQANGKPRPSENKGGKRA